MYCPLHNSVKSQIFVKTSRDFVPEPNNDHVSLLLRWNFLEFLNSVSIPRLQHAMHAVG
jgi:hypothetical protein